MPQAWKPNWPVVDDDGKVVPLDEHDPKWLSLAEERGRAVDRIGNLTLVTGTFNRGVSNSGWAQKREESEQQRSLVINYEVARSEAWGEDEIIKRSMAMAGAAARLWPSAKNLLAL